jgi:uncharacterized surface protein with fasciclin (FAS1) repeats
MLVLVHGADKVARVKFWLRTAALRSILLLLLLGTLVHGEPHKPKPPKIRDLSDTVANSVILTKFAQLVAAANLGTYLSSRGPFTLFVPTNSAFSKLPAGMMDDLLIPENQTQLQRLVLFHLVTGKMWDAKDLVATKSLISCEGNPLPLRTSHSGTQYVIKAKIIHADIRCSNGIIHQIDTLLMPPQMVLVAKMAANSSVAPANSATNAPPFSDVTSPLTETNAPTADTTNQAPTETNAPASMKGG